MKVELTSVTKMQISDLINSVHRLDPVSVFIEDLGSTTYERPTHISRQGKITIECYGSSWSAYWGGMGDRLVSEFFTDCSVDYLAGCLRRGTGLEPMVFCGDYFESEIKKTILDCRRGRGDDQRVECGPLDKDDARRLWDEVDDFIRDFDTPSDLMQSRLADSLLSDIYGPNWHHDARQKSQKLNPNYSYLCRVIAAVQEALRSIAKNEVSQ